MGGEQYLPFARSRVRALKALGLPYVDQSFEVDGVSIKVRIEPGHEYIRLEGNPTAYLESGQLEWTFPGELNPERYDPAKWHFLDIPTTDKYLGWAQTSPPKKTGTQKNKPDLYEGMPSIAVGYPQGEDADKNAETKAKYADTTIVKKLIANYFPASLFSGKMRLFIQAQYGGQEKIQPYGLEIGLVGTSAVLKYRGKKGATVQFGVYSHISPGIFTAPDGNYWLLSITNPTGFLYQVDAYPISTSPAASGMKQRLKESSMTDDERRKIEAYLFAEAYIDVDRPTRIGAFTGRMESSIGYGWKWNTDGSKAAIVVHEFKGTGASDNRWVARTIQIGITYEKDEASGNLVFRAMAETTLHGEWTDGWGTFNIFTTEDDPPVGGRLEHWSLAVNIFGRKPAFAFSDVSVYGYFVNDVWTPVTLSRTLRLDPVYTQSETGIFYEPGINMGIENRYRFGYLPANSSCTYRSELVTQGTEMTITFDGFSYLGRQRTGNFLVYTKDVASSGSEPNPIDFVSANLFDVSYYSPGNPPGYFSGDFNAGDTTVSTARVTRTWTTWTGYSNDAWVLVIPTCDAEAVYISTHAYDASDLVTTSFVASTGITAFSGEGGSFSPWSNAGSDNDWHGIANNETTGGNTDPRPESTTYVFNFNSVIHGVLGVPGGSYYALFNVDYNYPFYDRGMYTFTSAGGRYAMSEGLMFPGSVNFRSRFVGWA